MRELTRLKFLLTWNGLRKDWQRRIGLPAVLIAMSLIAWKLATGFVNQHGLLSPEQAGEFSMWAALGFFVGWVALPVVIFPLDETLDPAQLAVFPVPAPATSAGTRNRFAHRSFGGGPRDSDRLQCVGARRVGQAHGPRGRLGLSGSDGSCRASFHERDIRSASKPPGPRSGSACRSCHRPLHLRRLSDRPR